MKACMSVCVCSWMNLYICMYVWVHICVWIHVCVCDIVLCTWRESWVTVFWEKGIWRNGAKGSAGYSAKGWDSGDLGTESLFLFPFALRRKMACLGLLCCLGIWCSRFCRDNIWELAVSGGPLNRSMGVDFWDWVCLSDCCHSRSEGLKPLSSLSAAGMGHTGCRRLWPCDLKCRIFWSCPFVLSRLQT